MDVDVYIFDMRIGRSELAILKTLYSYGSMNVEQISRYTFLNKDTVRYCLRKLVEKNLVKKFRRKLYEVGLKGIHIAYENVYVLSINAFKMLGVPPKPSILSPDLRARYIYYPRSKHYSDASRRISKIYKHLWNR